MKQLSLSVLALAALAVSSVSAASFDASKGVQFGRAHHVARGHQDSGSVKGRRSTGSKAAYCAAKNTTVSSLSATTSTTTSSVIPTTSSVAPPPETTTSTKEAPPTTTKPPPPPPTTTSKPPPPPATTKAASSDSSSGGGQSFSPGDLTFYTPGLNACGTTDSYDAQIVAISAELWDTWPGFDGDSNNHPLCHKPITITWQGKTHPATITDRCAGCGLRPSLDCGPTLFAQFTTPDAGRVSGMSWTLD
ncbi:hypothetical protein FRB96_005925 [Tulasnella sp. 330]|nr:hypothetical protein FRB96_005925 [Tulasnella sp. 330]KAG8880628.1 hypothetical protein FRB98_004976 [Tulasnella sp. 332]KAG8882856.1 hypothetical protein FRB97_007680 [Tulasnella sp. 331]